MKHKNILLWGYTQVGKTTLLSTAFYSDPSRLQVIDRKASASAISQTLFRTWKRLQVGELTDTTSAEFINLPLQTHNGHQVSIHDVKGHIIGQIDRADISDRVSNVDAVLFVIEWGAKDLNRQMEAIDGAWPFCSELPKSLVLTKCELALTIDDPAWKRAPGWWQEHQVWRNHKDLLSRFQEAVWPCSAYGYNQQTGHPAVILGEYGQVFPYRIKPIGVAEPFEYVLSKLGL